jgi:hypothetical protein
MGEMAVETATKKVSGRIGRTVPRSEAGDRQRREAPLKHGLKAAQHPANVKTPQGASLTSITAISAHVLKVADIGGWLMGELGRTPEGVYRPPSDADVLAANSALVRTTQAAVKAVADLETGNIKRITKEGLDPAKARDLIKRNAACALVAVSTARTGANWLKKTGCYKEDGTIQPLIKRFASILNTTTRALCRHAEWIAGGEDDDDIARIIRELETEMTDGS